MSERRRPVPTTLPGGSPIVNAWLLQWADEREELETAEAKLVAVQAELAFDIKCRHIVEDELAAARVKMHEETARADFLENSADPEVSDLQRRVRALEEAHATLGVPR